MLTQLSAAIHEFVKDQYDCWREKLVPALAEESIRVRSFRELKPEARKAVDRFYLERVEPLMTPVTVDPAHPFPRVLNKALCMAFLLQKRRKDSQIYLGVVTVPRALPRVLRIPSAEGTIEYIFLHDIVQAYAERLYHGYKILSSAPFRVTRNSNLYLREEESRSILDSVDSQLHRRRKGAAVRLEIEAGADLEIIERLRSNFALAAWQVFQVNGPINLSRLFNLYDQTARPDLKFPSFTPKELDIPPDPPALFSLLRERDILLHHPYDSYSDGGAVHRKRGARSRRAFDQADALSHQRRFADRARADGGGGEKRSDRRRGAEGALRRSLEHPLGAQPAGSGRAGVSRARRAEDALQAGAAGAARSRRQSAALRASGNGQLQPVHGALLHRPEPAHQRSADHRGGALRVQFSDGVFRAGALRAAVGGAAEPGEELRQPDRPRSGACQGGAAGD